MKYYTSILLILFLFEGCSSNQPQVKNDANYSAEIQQNTQAIIEQKTEIISDESFEEEFDQEIENEFDPLSGYNRLMTTFNDSMFTYVISPVSEWYAYIFPGFIRESIGHFINNLQYPVRATNNLLQGKFQNVSNETERFIVNSLVGIGGLFDPATTIMKLPTHKEDFGQTLGYYGVGSGFHIVLPFIGPSNLRDAIGISADSLISPLGYYENLESYRIPNSYLEYVGYYGMEMINKNSLNLGAYEALKKDSIDLYPFFKNIYEQKRVSDINE